MPATTRYECHLVRTGPLLAQAQALRLRVLAEDMERAPPTLSSGRDEDWYDAHCDHLVVRAAALDRVVATWRALPPEEALRLGCYPADELFELAGLEVLRARMVELGKVCLHPSHRTPDLEQLLWTSLGRYLLERGHDFVLACASIAMTDGGHAAAAIYRAIADAAPSPDDLRTLPRRGLPLERLGVGRATKLPREMRAWIDNGAWVCGEPAWDRGFERAWIPTLLPLSRMRLRSLKDFLAKAA